MKRSVLDDMSDVVDNLLLKIVSKFFVEETDIQWLFVYLGYGLPLFT